MFMLQVGWLMVSLELLLLMIGFLGKTQEALIRKYPQTKTFGP